MMNPDDQFYPLNDADVGMSTGSNSSAISDKPDMDEGGEPPYYEFEISHSDEEGSSHNRTPKIAGHSNMRDKLRLLLLQEAMRDDHSTNKDNVTQSTSPRSHFFETRPGRTWHYEIDAPPGHGAHEPMKMVPAIGIPEDTQNINAKLRAMQHRNTTKFKGAAAFLMANSRLRKQIRAGNMANFDEDDFHKRTAIRVDVEMVSLSSGESWGSDELIPMFAPLEDAPKPIVEIGKAEAAQLLSKRRERRRDSFDAIVAQSKRGSVGANRRGSGAVTTMLEAMRLATTQVEGAIEGGVNVIGGGVSALEGGMQSLVHDTKRVVRGKSSRFKFPKFGKAKK